MKYSEMSVNERLYIAGLIDDFNNAIKQMEFQEAIDILMQTELTNKEANYIIDLIKKNPQKYGFS